MINFYIYYSFFNNLTSKTDKNKLIEDIINAFINSENDFIFALAIIKAFIFILVLVFILASINKAFKKFIKIYLKAQM